LATEKKFTLEDLSSSVLSPLKKYHPCVNMKRNYFAFFQNLKLLILMKKILSISLTVRLNLIPNTLGCNGLSAL